MVRYVDTYRTPSSNWPRRILLDYQSPLRQSLQAEKDAVLGWVWGFFTTTIDRWANAVVGVAVEMAFPLRTLPYFRPKIVLPYIQYTICPRTFLL